MRVTGNVVGTGSACRKAGGRSVRLFLSGFLHDAYPRYSMAARTVYRVSEGMARCGKRESVLVSDDRVEDKMGLYVLSKLPKASCGLKKGRWAPGKTRSANTLFERPVLLQGTAEPQ